MVVPKVEEQFREQSENSGSLDLSAGELVILVSKIYTTMTTKKLDLAKLNFLIFLAEGDGGIRSEITFEKTGFGPKSRYVENFVKNHKEIFTLRTSQKTKRSGPDADTRKTVNLTAEGKELSSRISDLLLPGKMRSLSHIVTKWSDEMHGDILTYICVFFGYFCPEINLKEEVHKNDKEQSAS